MQVHVHYRPDYEGLLDSVSGIVWEADPETLRFRFVSQQAERLLGYPVKAWMKDPNFWVDHIHPEDREWVPAFCRAATARHHAHEFEYRMIASDGSIVWLRDIVSVVVEKGRAVSVRGVMVDISERKRADEEHRVTTERLSTLVRNAPVILFAVDREGTITFCEGKGLDAAGIDPVGLVGRNASEWDRHTSEIIANIQRALTGEEFTRTVSFEGRVFQTRYTPVTDKTGAFDGFIGVATDLTEQVRAEEERRVLEAQLQHSQKLESLGVLAGGIAHDFNNLLTTILGYSELVLAELPPTSPSQAKLERIQRAARNAAGLTSQLLAYSGSTQLEVRPIDLSALVSDMADLLRVSISKKASLACELDQNLPAIEADAAQITQVVLNLITNASESLSDSNGSILVRTGLRQVDTSDLSKNYLKEELSEGPYVFLEVRDTGVGMDEETRRRIFDPFFSTKFVGRGLGLATTLGIVRRHRGGLSVESEPGKGTVFRVLLPCGARAVEAGSALPGGAASWRGSGTVLVVDDESDVRQLARDMLESLGFQVVTASHGREALEVFPARAEEIAIVLLDVTMPELSGEETALRLAKIRPETPIVLMSGYRQTYAASRLPGGIPAGFLHKPFDRDALVGVLRNLVPGSGS